MMRNKPIRVQFLFAFVALLILLFGLILLANIFLLKPFYVWTKSEQMTSISLKFNDIPVDLTNDDFQELLGETVYRNQTMVDIYSTEGALLFSSRSPHEEGEMNLNFTFSEQQWKELQEGGTVMQEVSIPHHNQVLLMSYRLLPEGEILSLSSPMAAIDQSVATLNEFLLIVLIVFLVLVWISATRFADYFSKPIVTLQQMTNRMIQFDFSRKWQETRRDELGDLGNNMNRLMSIIGGFIEELKGKNELLESELMRKNQLDRMRRQFVSNVSHELKTPIALIQGYAEGLQVNVNHDAASREEYCEVIIDEAKKMNQLVRELLELSQLELGENAMKWEAFPIESSLRTAVKRLQSLPQNQDITFELDFRTSSPEVAGDSAKINQVINNYLANALFFVDEHKQIRITTEMTGSHLRISVYNSGPLIPEEEMQLIWTSFYKVDKARKRGEGGTGLGLSIVKRIMDLHHMPYGVANMNDGVVFWFELPIAGSKALL